MSNWLAFCRRFNAEDVYTEMCRKFIARKFHDEKFPDKDPKDWFLFRNFKMELYDKEVGNNHHDVFLEGRKDIES